VFTAITRKVSDAIVRCELTYMPREPIDVGLALRQHEGYERCLAEIGCTVVSLPAEPDLPDAAFVEDTAVVVDEVAVTARPGVESRRPEVASVARALAQFRPTVAIEAPGTLDGGDVLCLGTRLFVGLSGRTNVAGIDQLRSAVAPFRYTVEALPVKGCLHLKSAVTQVAADTVVFNPRWVDGAAFEGLRRIEVDPAEPHGANALLVGGTVMYPAAFPRTAARLERAGIPLVRLDLSELAKAEGAVTCCSLILRA
jgi:dimethylargininase